MKQPQNAADWRNVKLKDVCHEITVGHVGPMASQYVDQGIPFLRSQNIEPFRLNRSDIKFISNEFHAKLKKSALRPGDVAVVRTGYPGTASVIPTDLPVANCADLVIIRPSQQINARFLVSIFNSTWGRSAVAGNLVGVAQQHFNIGAAKEMVVRLPPLPLQRKVAAILSAYDNLIENNLRRIEILEQMAQNLYREWFVKFRFPGHQHARFTDSPLGRIPEGWEVVPLSSVVDFAKGRKPVETRNEPITGDVRLLLIDALRGGNPKFTSPTRLVVAETRDTIMVMDGGSSCEVAQGFSGVVGSTLGRFRTTNPDRFSPHALYRLLKEKAGEFKSKNIGAAIPHANKDYILIQVVPLPPQTIALRFHDYLEPIQGTIEILKTKNTTLRCTRDLLLPRLISGEVDVSALDIAVPEEASA